MSGHEDRKSLAIYQDLSLADKEFLLHQITATFLSRKKGGGNMFMNRVCIVVFALLVLPQSVIAEDTCTSEQINRMVDMGWTPAQIKLICSNYRDAKGPRTKDVDFTPASQRRLCPTHIGSGDREFKGHGPVVKTWARLEQPTNTRIDVKIYLHAIETMWDLTEAEGSWTFQVYTAPSGWVIDDIITDKYSEANYTDTQHHPDKPRVQGGNLVNSFITMGDSGGNDVGNCTRDDVYVTVEFNQVTVRLKEK